MNIATTNIYGEVYSRDRLFDVDSCKIGQNLLLPGIELKRCLEEMGHSFHTADMYRFDDIDVLIFQDLDKCSRLLLEAPIDYVKYFLKRKWKSDYFYKCIKSKKKIRKILILQEPSTVCPQSYDERLHEYFDSILTWNDDLLKADKYHKFQYPQVPAAKKYKVPFEEKTFAVMIAGNKKSKENNELYSERYETVIFFENQSYEFDLYGFGWEKEGLKNYKGKIDKKLDVLSKYRFSICYENMCNVKGYITEKIFDCFFAGVVPVYWGADNITDYVPPETFIDRRKFADMDELCRFLANISLEEYEQYISHINRFLYSDIFVKEFSIDSYIKRIVKLLELR